MIIEQIVIEDMRNELELFLFLGFKVFVSVIVNGEFVVLEAFDLVVLENVGNLICPAEFDTGAGKCVMLLSVPEGDDKPLKYPLMFSVSDVLIITKTDVAPYFDFDVQKCIERAKKLNPRITVFTVSAKTGDGFAAWEDWLKEQVQIWKN